MKVICVCDRVEYNYALTGLIGYRNLKLTIGKEYDCLNETEFQYAIAGTIYYYIKDDYGDLCLCPVNNFLTVEEYRDKKLEELGI
jgi:hypothetical protein